MKAASIGLVPVGDSPKVTVLMPVYNGEKYLRPAVESILGQTLTDFEFLIIDDGSTDRSVEIIRSYDDPRIRLVHNETNQKLIATLNKGFALARGQYLARMDSDDISLPQRLEKQAAFMDQHPEVGVCGTWAKRINDAGEVLGRWQTPTGKDLAKLLWRPTPVIHPSAFIRAGIYRQFSYNPEYAEAEDYELWLRVAEKTKLHNLPEYLLLYRVHSESITALNREAQLVSSYRAFMQLSRSANVSFEEFKALMFAGKVNPLRRANKLRMVTANNRLSFHQTLIDNLKYLKYYLRHK